MHSFVSDSSLVKLKDCKIHNHQKISPRPRRAKPIDFASSLIVDVCFAFSMVIKCNGCKHATSVTIKSKFCSTVKLLSGQTFVIYSSNSTFLPWFLRKVKKGGDGPGSTSSASSASFKNGRPRRVAKKLTQK